MSTVFFFGDQKYRDLNKHNHNKLTDKYIEIPNNLVTWDEGNTWKGILEKEVQKPRTSKFELCPAFWLNFAIDVEFQFIPWAFY